MGPIFKGQEIQEDSCYSEGIDTCGEKRPGPTHEFAA